MIIDLANVKGQSKYATFTPFSYRLFMNMTICRFSGAINSQQFKPSYYIWWGLQLNTWVKCSFAEWSGVGRTKIWWSGYLQSLYHILSSILKNSDPKWWDLQKYGLTFIKVGLVSIYMVISYNNWTRWSIICIKQMWSENKYRLTKQA